LCCVCDWRSRLGAPCNATVLSSEWRAIAANALAGWTMRGFVGTMSELNARGMWGDSSLHGLELGLAAKVLRDSGADAATRQAQTFFESVEKTQRELQESTQKMQRELRQSVQKTQRGLQESTQKMQRELQETVERKQREAAEALREYTGQPKYRFGDLTKATWERLTGAKKEPKEPKEHPSPTSATT
jgi:DNA anti-recombination protein RmuC